VVVVVASIDIELQPFTYKIGCRALLMCDTYFRVTLICADRLQWRNIARELVARVLNFAHEETYCLVVQAAWQAGRPRDGSSARESHADLEEEEFGISLLSVLGEVLGAIEGNWQGVVALRIFVALVTRLDCFLYHLIAEFMVLVISF
jgi:hypothetical protein